jgi:hypothetical protein
MKTSKALLIVGGTAVVGYLSYLFFKSKNAPISSFISSPIGGSELSAVVNSALPPAPASASPSTSGAVPERVKFLADTIKFMTLQNDANPNPAIIPTIHGYMQEMVDLGYAIADMRLGTFTKL